MKDKYITTLVVTIDKKQYVQIGDDITIDCNQSNSRNEARLVIKAPMSVKITRIKKVEQTPKLGIRKKHE